MKKSQFKTRGKIKLWIIIFAIVVVSLVLADHVNEPHPNRACHNLYVRGDANNDGILDVSDAVFILSYLFIGGSSSECLEYGDLNGDNTIDISDSIYLLEYLFKGSSPPKNTLGETELFGEGIDDPVQIGWVAPFDIPEEVSVKIPMTFSVADVNFESDIQSCIVTAVEVDKNNQEIGARQLILQTEWQFLPDEKGNDISSQPFEFVLKEQEILKGAKYQLEVTCNDKTSSDTIALYVNTLTDKEAEESIEEEVQCTQNDRCCATTKDGKVAYACLKDVCAQNGCENLRYTALGVFDKDDWFEVEDADGNPQQSICNAAGTHFVYQCPLQLASEKAEHEFTPLIFSTTTECKVKEMKILRKNEDKGEIPSEFKPAEDYSKPTLNEGGLGHNEGWSSAHTSRGSRDEWRFAYRFIVLAKLEEGSDPTKCYEAQFTKSKRGSLRGIKTHSTKPYEYKDIDIIYKNQLSNLFNANKIPDFNTLEKTFRYGVDAGCFIESDILCMDDYTDISGGPGNDPKKWIFEVKQHYRKNPPMIVWYDNPGIITSQMNQDGSINKLFFDFSYLDFVSIIEDSDSKHRFICVMDGLKLYNDPSKVNYNQRVQVTEPHTCQCRDQTWNEEVGIWLNGDTILKC